MPTNIARLQNMNVSNTCQDFLESLSNSFLSYQPTPITMETGSLVSFWNVESLRVAMNINN